MSLQAPTIWAVLPLLLMLLPALQASLTAIAAFWGPTPVPSSVIVACVKDVISVTVATAARQEGQESMCESARAWADRSGGGLLIAVIDSLSSLLASCFAVIWGRFTTLFMHRTTLALTKGNETRRQLSGIRRAPLRD
jgi:hypothetical protein